MPVLKRQIFAGITINANLRDFERLGEVDEFIHQVADVLVDEESKTLHIVRKESTPVDRDGLTALLGVEGIDLAHQAALGAAAVDQLTAANARIASLEAAADAANASMQAALDAANAEITLLKADLEAAQRRNAAAASALAAQ